MRIDPAVDRISARIAERHFGFLTPAQARKAGHTDRSLRTRIGNGLYVRHGRLYRLAGTPHSWQGDAYAAVANGPPGALASHLTAAALFGMCSPPRVPHITVGRDANHRVYGASTHRSDVPLPDRARIGVIPVTTPARTLVDAAGVLGSARLRDLVDAALVAGLASRTRVTGALERASQGRGRKGQLALVEALDIWTPGIHRDSTAEARLFRLVVGWGFPPPVPLFVIRDADDRFVCEVDAAWPDRSVALEYDSLVHHHDGRWERDEARAAAAAALGWRMVPVDKSDVRPGGHDRLRDLLVGLLAA